MKFLLKSVTFVGNVVKEEGGQAT